MHSRSCFHFSDITEIEKSLLVLPVGLNYGAPYTFSLCLSKEQQPSPCAHIVEATSKINLPTRGNHNIFPRGGWCLGWGKDFISPVYPYVKAKVSKEPLVWCGTREVGQQWATVIVSSVIYADVL